MSTKPDNRIAERTKERAEERRRQQRRRQLQVGGVIAATIVLVVVALVIIANSPSEAPIPADAVARYEGMTTITNSDGYPMIGRDNAKVEVEVFAAFTEPQAYNFYRDVYPALLERVRAGEISLAFAPLKIGVGRNPEGAARAALCAAEQDRFWPTFDTFFSWSNAFEDSAFNTNRLRAGVEALGMNTAAFNDCFGQGRISDLLVKAQQGINGPVTVRVNGAVVAADLTTINTQIDTFAPFNVPSEATAEATDAAPEATAEVTPHATTRAIVLPTSSAQQPEATAEATTEPTAGATQVPDVTAEATQRAIVLPTSAAQRLEATAEATAGS